MLVAIGALFLGVPDGREAHVLDFMEKSSARTLTPQQQQEQAQQQAQQELAAAAMGNAGGEVDEGRALLLAHVVPEIKGTLNNFKETLNKPYTTLSTLCNPKQTC